MMLGLGKSRLQLASILVAAWSAIESAIAGERKQVFEVASRDVDSINIAEFWLLIAAGEPLVFRRAFSSWLADDERLLREYGHYIVGDEFLKYSKNHLVASINELFGFQQGVKGSLGATLLNKSLQPPDLIPLLFQHPLLDKKLFSHLLQDLPSWMLGPTIFAHFGVFGTANASRYTSCLHYDPADNLFAQFNGRKRFALYPFEDHDNVAPMLATPSYSMDCIRSARPTGLSVDELYAEFNEPERHMPSFTSATRYEVDLEAGDVLFIPRFWWHTTFAALGQSLAVSSWFMHPNPYTMLFHALFMFFGEDVTESIVSEEDLWAVLPRGLRMRGLPEPYASRPFPRKLKAKSSRSLAWKEWNRLCDDAFRVRQECLVMSEDPDFLPGLVHLLGENSPVAEVFKLYHKELSEDLAVVNLHNVSCSHTSQWLRDSADRRVGLWWRREQLEQVTQQTLPSITPSDADDLEGAEERLAFYLDVLFPGCRRDGSCPELYRKARKAVDLAVLVRPCELGTSQKFGVTSVEIGSTKGQAKAPVAVSRIIEL